MGSCSIVVTVIIVVASGDDGASGIGYKLAVLPLYYNLHCHKAGDDEAVDEGVDGVLEATL